MPTTATPPAAAAFLAELEQESQSTRALLQAVPADKLEWSPHERSFSLGKMASHVATIPGQLSEMLQADTFDFADADGVTQPASQAELLTAFDAGLADARTALNRWTSEDLAADWSVAKAGTHIMTVPRAAAIRTLLLNHLYHHRGQLTVYLRLLNVPLPSVYGPTADVDPFAAD